VSKDKLVGSYYACRQKVDAVAVAKGLTPDYGKCTTKFTGKWDSAETAGASLCPDHIVTASQIESYVAGQASAAAAIVAGSGDIPVCGDGVINVAGEHCDGLALDGLTCESFGIYGTLGCTVGCELELGS